MNKAYYFENQKSANLSNILEIFVQDIDALGMRDFGQFGSNTLIGNPAPVEIGYLWEYQNLVSKPNTENKKK